MAVKATEATAPEAPIAEPPVADAPETETPEVETPVEDAPEPVEVPALTEGRLLQMCREMKMPPEHLRVFDYYATSLVARINAAIAADNKGGEA